MREYQVNGLKFLLQEARQKGCQLLHLFPHILLADKGFHPIFKINDTLKIAPIDQPAARLTCHRVRVAPAVGDCHFISLRNQFDSKLVDKYILTAGVPSSPAPRSTHARPWLVIIKICVLALSINF